MEATDVQARGGIPSAAGEAGGSLNRLATSATLHCLTGCAAGEVSGMMIAAALGWGDLGSIALAVGLAYLFGFSLTSLPLIRAGLAAGAVVSTALAADTVSITIMEVIDNVVVALVPGALDSSVGDPLLYGAIALGFAIAFPFAWWVNRSMIARGRGCAVMHEAAAASEREADGGTAPRLDSAAHQG